MVHSLYLKNNRIAKVYFIAAKTPHSVHNILTTSTYKSGFLRCEFEDVFDAMLLLNCLWSDSETTSLSGTPSFQYFYPR